MSLVRAFTTRRNKPKMAVEAAPVLTRAASQRAGRPVVRALISSPLALLSTSNVMLNNAQDIAGTSPIDFRSISSGSSAASSSGYESDGGSSHASFHSCETVTDASSVDESPISSEPEPNHLSCYFKPAVSTQPTSLTRSLSTTASTTFDTPKIPQRAASHSKRAHEGLHRQRSIQRMMSPPPSRGRDIARDSADMFCTTLSAFIEAPQETPFSHELAQLDEVAEEFGQVVSEAETSDDLAVMQSGALAHFAASDYLAEIESMIFATYNDEGIIEVPAWI